jgi:hypothetical protein
MSKQSDAKAAQEYSEITPTCKNCVNYTSDITTHEPSFSWGQPYATEKNRRCAVGGFAVKTTASCKLWAERNKQ